MIVRRNAGTLILSLTAAFFLYACGGGGGGGTAPPAAPTATTASSTPSIDSALINGNVNPNGQDATAWFEYGQDSSLSNPTRTDNHPIGFGTAPLSINETINGLNAGTTYWYRVAASNSAGTAVGKIEKFDTLSLLPTVVTATQSPGANSAAVTGSVNPNGLATSAWFEYAQDPDSLLSNPTTTDNQAIGSGKAPVSINATLAPLNSTTTYYWRAAATNAEGTSKGSIKTFTTTPDPPPIANPGPDQSVFMGDTVTLDGSGSSDGGHGGTIVSYMWTQTGGTDAPLSDPTVASPTFTAPSVSQSGEVLTFQLTVTSSRGPTATDSVNITVNWGVFDDFGTDTTSDYDVDMIRADGGVGTFEYDESGQRVRVSTGDDVVLRFSRDLPPSDAGVLSLDFSPILSFPTHAGVWVRLVRSPLTDNTFYQVSNFDWSTFGFPPQLPDLAAFKKFVGGVEVESVSFPTSYMQGSTYPIKITFGPAVTTMEAFGQVVNLSGTGGITFGTVEIHTGQQDAYYDNIRLEAAP